MNAFGIIARGPWALVAGLLVFYEVCTSSASAAPDLNALVTAVRAQYLLPRYETLARETNHLQAAVEGLCNDDAAGPSPEQRAAADRVFHAAMDAWQAAQHIRHGPAVKNDRHTRIQFWPDKRGRAGKHLSRLLHAGVAPASRRGRIGPAPCTVQ